MMQSLIRRCSFFSVILFSLLLAGCGGSSGSDGNVSLAGGANHYDGRTDEADLSLENAGVFVRSLLLMPFDPLVIADTTSTRSAEAAIFPWHFPGAARSREMLRARTIASESGDCGDSGSYAVELIESKTYPYGVLNLHLKRCDEYGVFLDGSVRIGVTDVDQATYSPKDFVIAYSDLRRRTRQSHYLYNGHNTVRDRARCNFPGQGELDLVIDDVTNTESVWFKQTKVSYLALSNCSGAPSDTHASIDGPVFHSLWGRINANTRQEFGFDSSGAFSANPYRIPESKGTLILTGENQSRVAVEFASAALPAGFEGDIPNKNFTRIEVRDANGEEHPILTFSNSDLNTGTLLELTDSDNDGLPDSWEKLHRLDPADATDAIGDADGDGISNREEFQILGDPHSTTSEGIGGRIRIAMAPGSVGKSVFMQQSVDVLIEGSNSTYLPNSMQLRLVVPDEISWVEHGQYGQCHDGKEVGEIICTPSKNAAREHDGKMLTVVTLLLKGSLPGDYRVTAELSGTPDYFLLAEPEAAMELAYVSPPPELELNATADILLSDDGLLEPISVVVSHSIPAFANDLELVGTYPEGLYVNEARAQYGDATIHCETVPDIRCHFDQLLPDQEIELLLDVTGKRVHSTAIAWSVSASNADPDWTPSTSISRIFKVQSTDVLQAMIDAMPRASAAGIHSSVSWLTMPPGYYYGNIDIGNRTVRLFGSDKPQGTTLIGNNPDLAIFRNMAAGSSIEDFRFVVQGVAAQYESRDYLQRETKVANSSFRPRLTLDEAEQSMSLTSLVSLPVSDEFKSGTVVIENNEFVGFGQRHSRHCETLIKLDSAVSSSFRSNQFRDLNCQYNYR